MQKNTTKDVLWISRKNPSDISFITDLFFFLIITDELKKIYLLIHEFFYIWVTFRYTTLKRITRSFHLSSFVCSSLSDASINSCRHLWCQRRITFEGTGSERGHLPQTLIQCLHQHNHPCLWRHWSFKSQGFQRDTLFSRVAEHGVNVWGDVFQKI